MAQLKDALIMGDARVLGKLYADQSLPDGVFHLTNIGGTAAVTTSPYTSAKWYTTVNDPRITSLYSGLTISLKIPVAGHATYCTLLNVNGLGDHPVVYNINSNISTRYGVGSTAILTYNATQTANGYDASTAAVSYTGCWQIQDYDNTNIYQLRDNNGATSVASDAGSLYRYEICLTNKECQLVPYNNTSNATTTYTKTLNSASFDPFGPIYYYNSTTTVNAGSNVGASTLYYHINIDARYSMNLLNTGTAGATALTAHKPVYIVATYDETTGLATLINNTSATSYLERSSIKQSLPDVQQDGKIFIYLGRASSLYQIELSPVHPVYKWDRARDAWAIFDGSVASNWLNGSAAGSVRTSYATKENSSYTMGLAAVAEGYSTKASGKYSHAEGDGTSATDMRAHAEGVSTQASANAAHAEGSSTIASGSYAHSEGSKTRATNFGTHAEGTSTHALGSYSHAEGYFSLAYGSYAHAEGQWGSGDKITGTITAIDETNLQVSVSGIPRRSVGDYKYNLCGVSNDWDVDTYISNASYSSNIYTFTVSKWNTNFAVDGTFNIYLRQIAYGNGSHAEGQGTYAFSPSTHTEGWGTVAYGSQQHVQGKWNLVSSDYADIVGNGTNESNRSNAYTLDWDGNGIYAGKLTVGSDPANNMDVATKQYVDALVSSGSNTNGKYFRIGDIQICTHTINVEKTGSSNFGSGTTYYGSGSWTYSQAFTEIWSVQVTAENTASGLFTGSAQAAPGLNSCAIEWMGSNLTSGSIPLTCLAIGKWK